MSLALIVPCFLGAFGKGDLPFCVVVPLGGRLGPPQRESSLELLSDIANAFLSLDVGPVDVGGEESFDCGDGVVGILRVEDLDVVGVEPLESSRQPGTAEPPPEDVLEELGCLPLDALAREPRSWST